MQFLLADLKRGFCERRFYAATAIGIISLLCSVLYVLYSGYDSPLSLFQKSHGLLLPFIAPLLAAYPYSTMNMTEDTSGFITFMSMRQKKNNWTWKRFIVNGMVGGTTVTLPTLCLLIVCIFLGLGDNTTDLLPLLGLNFLFGFSFSSLSYGLTAFNVHSYLPLIIPQVIYFFFIYSFPILGLSAYYPPLAFSPYIFSSLSSYDYSITFLLLMIGASVLLVLIGQVKKTALFQQVREVFGL